MLLRISLSSKVLSGTVPVESALLCITPNGNAKRREQICLSRTEPARAAADAAGWAARGREARAAAASARHADTRWTTPGAFHATQGSARSAER